MNNYIKFLRNKKNEILKSIKFLYILLYLYTVIIYQVVRVLWCLSLTERHANRKTSVLEWYGRHKDTTFGSKKEYNFLSEHNFL